MSDYERPSFQKKWWDEVSQYLKENPEEGFDQDQVKEFIKYCVNRHMNTDQEQIMTKGELKEIIEELK